MGHYGADDSLITVGTDRLVMASLPSTWSVRHSSTLLDGLPDGLQANRHELTSVRRRAILLGLIAASLRCPLLGVIAESVLNRTLRTQV
jgi:hypothetical protein